MGAERKRRKHKEAICKILENCHASARAALPLRRFAAPRFSSWRRGPRCSSRRASARWSSASVRGGQGQQNWENQQKFANFWRARSLLYQNEILQENMRSTAFFKLYKSCILLQCCNLKNSAKSGRFEKSAIFVKIQQKFCKCRKICKYCQLSKISA